MVYSIDDPAEMSPSGRFREVAWILAAGFLRMAAHCPRLSEGQLGEAGRLPQGNSPEVPEVTVADHFAAKGLDVSHP